MFDEANMKNSLFYLFIYCSVALIVLVSCNPVSTFQVEHPQLATELTTQSVTPIVKVAVGTETSTIEATMQGDLPTIPVYTQTPDTRLTAKYWREWDVVPILSFRAKEILRSAIAESDLDPHTFSKVGDCQFTTGTFLAGYVTGVNRVPSGMEQTVLFFSDSILQESITAENGLGISSVLNPMFGLAAGYTECMANETPLDCELRVRQPSIVLIAMGTNWVPHAEISYEKYLRRVIDRILETGALPILSTKADNIEGDWKLNEVTAKVAYDYDLPLVNVWRAVRFLPNHGLESPENMYLTGDGWLARNDAWLRALDSVRRITVMENIE